MVEECEATENLGNCGMEDRRDRFLSSVEMASALGHYPGAVANTLRIADACTLTFPLPNIPERGKDSARRARLVEALKQRRQWLPRGVAKVVEGPNYKERLAKELDGGEKRGWSLLPLAAFAAVQELDDWQPVDCGAECAASLVMYQLGLSSVDPVELGIVGSGVIGLGSGFAAPEITLNVAKGAGERIVAGSAQQLAGEGVVQGSELRTLDGGEVMARVARSLGVGSEQTSRALARLAPTNELGDEMEWAHALCREAPDLDVERVAVALVAGKPAPAGARAESSLIVPPGGDASLLPLTRLSDGRVVAQYGGAGAAVLGFGSVVVKETSGMTFAAGVLDRLRSSQLFGGWPLWSRLPMDDRETWQV